MRTDGFDVAIVGGGLAGAVAADRLSDHGVRVVILDDNQVLGGQILRRHPCGQYMGNQKVTGFQQSGLALLDRLKAKQVSHWPDSQVLGIYPGQELLVQKQGRGTAGLTPDFILFATGARERFIPFPGWTLPGVMAGGAVQILLKTSGLAPSGSVFLAGSGLFLYAVAHDLLKAGAGVGSIMTENAMRDITPSLKQAVYNFSKMIQGAGFMARILLGRVPIRPRTRIIEARGVNRLEEIVFARTDRQGLVIPNTQTTCRADILITGHGFVANTELPQLAGCALEYADDKGGWAVQVTPELETSVAGIFAAGETTGIGGAYKSMHEGEMAAAAILHRLGKISRGNYRTMLERQTLIRKRHLDFGRYFNRLTGVSQKALLTVPDETVLCRCEDVTMADMRRAMARGCHSPSALKKALRIGMGSCQGRTCAPAAYGILAAHTGHEKKDLPPLTCRPPVRPVSLGSLLE